MNIYQDIYDIIQTYLFGGVELSANMDLVAITLATIGTVFVFSLPFLVVWKILKIIMG